MPLLARPLSACLPRLHCAGESEAGLRGIFAAAQRLAPAMIFIDEVDAIAPARGALAHAFGLRHHFPLFLLVRDASGRAASRLSGEVRTPATLALA